MEEKEGKSWTALLIAIFLIVMGSFFIYVTWDNKILNIKNFYKYFCDCGAEFIFSILFIIIGIFMIGVWITEYIIKSKTDILYVLKTEKVFNYYKISFIDRKGKIYKYLSKNSNVCAEKYFYEVIRTRFNVKEIIGLSSEKFEIVKEKEPYWLNLYIPIKEIKKIEDLCVLPVVYAWFLTGFFSFILEEGTNRLYGFFIGIIPFSLIIYDFKCKIKNK